MATWYGTASLDALLNDIKSKAIAIHLLDTYSAGQNYSTVIGNSIGSAAITSGDFTGPTANGNDRRLTFDGAQGNATADSSVEALHLALLSGSEVLAVTNETTDQPITNGNPLTFPSFYMQASQPTQVA